MAYTAKIPTLHVEGRNDLYVIAGLVERHGVSMKADTRPFHIKDAPLPDEKTTGVEVLLANLSDAIREATDRAVGFVLDTDVLLTDRWAAVAQRLAAAGLSPPPECPAGGYLDRVPGYPHPCGVWLMPDCRTHEGTLEYLLKTLVPRGDPLWPHAEACTDGAAARGARFSAIDRSKAVTHCWLAWQEKPGLPFGTAITARYLNHDSPEALGFLAWLGKLYSIPALTALQSPPP